MKKKELKLKSILMVSVICLLIVAGGVFFVSSIQEQSVVENNDLISYGDNVRVSESIAECFENESHIPRSVSINKKLKENGECS